MDKAFVVINPAAGRGGSRHMRQTIEDACHRAGWVCTFYETTGADSLSAVTREAIEAGANHIIVAGGDGTVAAVATGLLGSELPLGIVPAGTGNVLARELGIPLQAERAMSLIVALANVRALDAMRIGERAFFLNASIGFSSLVVDATGARDKRWLGRIAYVWNGFLKLFGLRRYRFLVEVDGARHRVRASEVLVVNTAGLGEPFIRLPGVLPDDGELCVCIIRARHLIDWLLMGFDFVLRREREPSHITRLVSRQSVSITADAPLPAQADGEMLGTGRIALEMIPSALLVIAPKTATNPLLLLAQQRKDDATDLLRRLAHKEKQGPK